MGYIRLLVLCSSLIVLVSGASFPTARFVPEEGNIVGGQEVEPHSVPFQITTTTATGSRSCGGAILNEDTVISAAHCTTPAQVLAGRHDLSVEEESSQERLVVEIIDHPMWGETAFGFDFRILKLSSPLEFNQFVQPIALPPPRESESDEPFVNEDAQTFGWGRKEDGSFPDVLHGVTVPVVSDQDCKDSFGSRLEPDNMICAGETGLDSCKMDSGGPLVLANSNVHIGVVSWGIGCGDEGYPGVYAETQAFLDFIEENS